MLQGDFKAEDGDREGYSENFQKHVKILIKDHDNAFNWRQDDS